MCLVPATRKVERKRPRPYLTVRRRWQEDGSAEFGMASYRICNLALKRALLNGGCQAVQGVVPNLS
jgi:hypothetical protein